MEVRERTCHLLHPRLLGLFPSSPRGVDGVNERKVESSGFLRRSSSVETGYRRVFFELLDESFRLGGFYLRWLI